MADDAQSPPERGADLGGRDLPRLVTIGHPRLALPSAPVPIRQIATPEFVARLETLADAMDVYQGIGIAAPQIGWFERFFVMVRFGEEADQDEEQEGLLDFWINPEITAYSDDDTWAWEGCLSVPGLRGWIRRPAAVAVRGYNEWGEPISREYAGWDARLFQHEYDHLDGMLFPYRAVDPRHVVMLEHLAQRDAWPDDWPAPGARDTEQGELWAEPA